MFGIQGLSLSLKVGAKMEIIAELWISKNRALNRTQVNDSKNGNSLFVFWHYGQYQKSLHFQQQL